MPVYVDKIQEYPESMVNERDRRYGTRWAHLYADSVAELKAFAWRNLRLNRKHIQGMSKLPHFDLTPSKATDALAYGAIYDPGHKHMERLCKFYAEHPPTPQELAL